MFSPCCFSKVVVAPIILKIVRKGDSMNLANE